MVVGPAGLCTNYIPNVGFIIGLIPPTVVALLDHGPGTAIAVIVVYTVLNVIIQSVIQPRVVGSTVGLSGTLSFLSLVVWTSVIGAVGALLAVPATLFVKAIFIDVDPHRRWLVPLISNAQRPRSQTPKRLILLRPHRPRSRPRRSRGVQRRSTRGPLPAPARLLGSVSAPSGVRFGERS